MASPSGSNKQTSGQVSPMLDLYRTIYGKCNSVLVREHNLSSTELQVKSILSEDQMAFDQWYCQQIVPSLRVAQQAQAKSMSEAIRHKQFADTYKEMAEECFYNKAFESFNKAIIFTPSEENEFLFDCLAQRSNLHYHCDQFESALLDMEQALSRRVSFTCIERKVVLLKALGRTEEAFDYVSHLVASKVFSDNKRIDQLKNWRKELKQYKTAVTNKQSTVKQSDKGSSSYFLQIDPRVTITRNNFNQRCGLKATENIPPQSTVLQEEPTITAISPAQLHSFCAQCFTKCDNTFWPCPNCTEVVFCSQECAQQGNQSEGDHRSECGMIGAMHDCLELQAKQVYRQLARVGHKELLKLDSKVTTYPYKKFFRQLTSAQPNVDRTQVHKWFANTQAEVRHWLAERSSSRTCTELTNAIFVLAIYFYKLRAEQIDLSQRTICELVCLLALEQAKVSVTEYSWHDTNHSGQQFRVGTFQCLIGSRVGHSCENNAEWTFDQNLRQFSLKTIKRLSKGDQITISFGNVSYMSFFQRLTYLKQFHVMCACARCVTDSQVHFALRCTLCNGPVPCDEKEFPNNRCMTCERQNDDYTRSKVKKIFQEFRTVRSMIWLIGEAVSKEQLNWIENKMSTFSVIIDLNNRQFISMIRALCHEYIRRHMFKLAITWYQWLVDGIGIYLCADSDSFVHFHNLDQWASAYTKYLERMQQAMPKNASKEKYSVAVLTGVAEGIFKRMFSLLEALNLKQCNFFDGSPLRSADYEQMIKSLYQTTRDKFVRFQEISSKVKRGGQPKRATSESGDEYTKVDDENGALSVKVAQPANSTLKANTQQDGQLKLEQVSDG